MVYECLYTLFQIFEVYITAQRLRGGQNDAEFVLKITIGTDKIETGREGRQKPSLSEGGVMLNVHALFFE